MSEYPTEHVLGTDSGNRAVDADAVPASLTPLAQQYLDQTRPWVRFLSVLTFASAGLMVLMGLAMLAASVFSGFVARSPAGPGGLGGAVGTGLIALFYLALACAYIAPGLYLSRYASAIKHLKSNGTTAGLEDALKQQKSFWRSAGILTVVGIGVGVIVIALMIVAAVTAAMMAARK